ncbi:MAG TPA: SemiSWEET transporter [Caulobacteraceae bacterium]|jgi:MtN3 and saliva related transmembrane protein|nr:SemiSWEET transporter [Caulobacteraceae bacterium]
MDARIMVGIIGAGAAVCSTTSFIPQLLKLFRERHAEAVSLRMYVLTVSAFALWTIYGFMLKSWPLVASNLISLGLSSAILFLSHRRQDEDRRPRSERR